MRITGEQIQALFQGVAGRTVEKNPTPDRAFWAASLAKYESILSEQYAYSYRWTPEVFDCDDFALIVSAFVRQNRYKEMMERGLALEQRYALAFGRVFVPGHAICFFVTDEDGMGRLYYFEPQKVLHESKAIWRPEPGSNADSPQYYEL